MRAIEKANQDTLYGIFGDASWTNKNRLSDATLTTLIEHFSQHKQNHTTPVCRTTSLATLMNT